MVKTSVRALRCVAVTGREGFNGNQNQLNYLILARVTSRAHFLPGGTRRFSSSSQLNTTLICVGAVSPAERALTMRKCRPSRETS